MNKKILSFLEQSLFLKDIKCIFCDAELDRPSLYCVCGDCLNKLPYLNGKVCKKCGEPIESLAEFCMRCKNHVDRGFDKARAEFLYKDEIAKSVKDLKYFGKKYLAEYLSKFVYDVYVRENFSCDVVIPVPISKKSLKSRGFNQAELLCKTFLDNGVEVNSNCVVKSRETENQAKLNYRDRQTNIVDAFEVADKAAVKNKNILLVDDVLTTGATVGEISRILKKAGAKSVNVITLCHEMPDGATN